MKVNWDDYSQYMENKVHVPNHQPVGIIHLKTRIDRSCLGCLHTTVVPNSFRLACVQPASAALECLQCSHCRRHSKGLPVLVLYPADLVPWLQFFERVCTTHMRKKIWVDSNHITGHMKWKPSLWPQNGEGRTLSKDQ